MTVPGDDAKRLTTLDDAGWTLVDAEAALASGDGIYWLPPRREREHLGECLPEGGLVKLVFRILDPGDPATPVTEWMWVSLTGREGAWYHGHLVSRPHTGTRLVRGTAVWYMAEHVIDFAGPEGEGLASAHPDVLHCRRHGPSDRCWVCEHITPTGAPCGFNTASNAADRRPDAWCDACDDLLEGLGSWSDVGARAPDIRLVCGACYDALRRRHERANA